MPAPARKRTATLATPASESRPILAVILGLLATFFVVAFVSHSVTDENLVPSWFTNTTDLVKTHNYCGSLGATAAFVLFNLFGYGAFFVPAFLFAAAWFALNQRAQGVAQLGHAVHPCAQGHRAAKHWAGVVPGAAPIASVHQDQPATGCELAGFFFGGVGAGG